MTNLLSHYSGQNEIPHFIDLSVSFFKEDKLAFFTSNLKWFDLQSKCNKMVFIPRRSKIFESYGEDLESKNILSCWHVMTKY